MKILINILLLAAIGYQLFRLAQYMKKSKQPFLIPATVEEKAAIRSYPQDKASKEKKGFGPYLFVFSAIIILYGLGYFFAGDGDWAFNLMLLLLLFNSNNLLNGFAVIEDGVLSRGRFIPWNKIKKIRFTPIDRNHKYYGYSQEVNNGSELHIEGSFFAASCIVTTAEMKEKLTEVLLKHAVNVDG